MKQFKPLFATRSHEMTTVLLNRVLDQLEQLTKDQELLKQSVHDMRGYKERMYRLEREVFLLKNKGQDE